MHEKYHNACLTINATVQIQRTRFVTMEMPIKGSRGIHFLTVAIQIHYLMLAYTDLCD